MKSPTLRYVCILGLMVFSFLIYSTDFAYADHSLGRTCYYCHNLRSTGVIIGTRSISISKKFLGWPTILETSDGGSDYVRGGPFDCSFCHGLGDMRDYFRDAGLTPAKESSHPVNVIDDEDDHPNEILCADCHLKATVGYDLVPFQTQAKNDTDGYPNHRSTKTTANGFLLYGGDGSTGGPVTINYPIDENNKPHLTAPYGYSQSPAGDILLPGYIDQYVDWSANFAAPLTKTDMLCFICHDGSADSVGITRSGNVATQSYNIWDEYFNEADDAKPIAKRTYGHIMRIDGSATSDILAGDKMPCFNCHDSHSGMSSDNVVNVPKLLRNLADRPNVYSTAAFSIEATDVNPGGVDDINPANGKIDNARPVCAKCHGSENSIESTSKNVDSPAYTGMTPVNPYYSATSGEFHIARGVTADIVSSTVGCLESTVTDSVGGCHRTAHNPSPTAGPCWTCHSKYSASTVTHVDEDVENTWGRGGSFGNTATLNTKILNNDPNFPSTHNIDFSETIHGADGSIAGHTRGSCTVCHTIEVRTYSDGSKISTHGDGDPRNDFRDVDPDPQGANEQTGLAPVEVSKTEGFRYVPEWMLCVDCHDDEANVSDEYYGIIGDNLSAPMNFDEFSDSKPTGNPDTYIYGSGDTNTNAYHVQVGNPDIIGGMGDGEENATPTKRYNMQPYKAHYYQTDGTTEPPVVWTGIDLNGAADTDPMTATPLPGTYLATDRIINCLECHNGHGSYNEALYRSPDPEYNPVVDPPIVKDGRTMCIDCHDDKPAPNEINFPPPDQITQSGGMNYDPNPQPAKRLMWTPPVIAPNGYTDRYGDQIMVVIGAAGSETLVNPHDYTQATANNISCTTGTTANNPTTFKCHNTHAPSCEACHSYSGTVGGGLDVP